MKGTLAKRGRQCSSLEKAVDKAVADKDAAEKRLKEAEAGWKWVIEEKMPLNRRRRRFEPRRTYRLGGYRTSRANSPF